MLSWRAESATEMGFRHGGAVARKGGGPFFFASDLPEALLATTRLNEATRVRKKKGARSSVATTNASWVAYESYAKPPAGVLAEKNSELLDCGRHAGIFCRRLNAFTNYRLSPKTTVRAAGATDKSEYEPVRVDLPNCKEHTAGPALRRTGPGCGYRAEASEALSCSLRSDGWQTSTRQVHLGGRFYEAL